MDQRIKELLDNIEEDVRKLDTNLNAEEWLDCLSKGLKSLCNQVRHIGSDANEQINIAEHEEAAKVPHIFTLYEWLGEIKKYAILWRDTIFESQKAIVFLEEENIEIHEFHELKEASVAMINQAKDHIIKFTKEEYQQAESSEERKTSLIETFVLKSNPWPIYKEQFDALSDQSHQLLDQHGKVLATRTTLLSLQNILFQTLRTFTEELERIKSQGHATLEEIEREKNNSWQKLSKSIESLENQVLAANVYNAFLENSAKEIETIVGEVEVPVHIDGSQIQSKKIDFQNLVKQWLESEIQPLMSEIQESLDSIGNNMKISLINVKNRLALGAPEGQELNEENIALGAPIQSTIQMIELRYLDIQQLIEEVKSRINAELHIINIYDNQKEFLGSPQQYLISQLHLDQTAWIQKLKNWFVKRAGFAKGFMADVANEEALSTSEKIVRFVKSRRAEEENHQYTNIFTTQGYIGESFWVGREKELQRMDKLITSWKGGFRGSVVLSGKRFSGKTVFGELIAHRYFPSNTIRIQPNSFVEVNGRIFEVKEDLEEALAFVKKHTLNKPHLVWIDNIELWSSHQIPVSRNLKSLLNAIDTLSADLFFMVSMSNWFKHHYNNMLKMEKVFQAEINLDVMSEEEIRESIMIRHGATHKKLVDDEGALVLPQEFSKMVQRLARMYGGNIGEALNHWSYFTKRRNDQEVSFNPNWTLSMPDFINDENSILIRAVLMNKRTNEYRLRKSLGKAFQSKYKAIVQRLINLGVLVRHGDGLLEVSEGVVNEVAALMDENRYIKSTFR